MGCSVVRGSVPGTMARTLDGSAPSWLARTQPTSAPSSLARSDFLPPLLLFSHRALLLSCRCRFGVFLSVIMAGGASFCCDAFSVSPAACYKMRSEQQSARQGAEREVRRSNSARSVMSFDAVLSFHLITNFHQNLKLFANLIVIWCRRIFISCNYQLSTKFEIIC